MKCHFCVGWVLGLWLHASPLPALDQVVQTVIDHAREHPDGQAACSFPHDVYKSPDRSPLPIGVFDSGIGGLTVLEAILKLDAYDNDTLQPGADGRPDFENEHFVYFGDQANMPYGNYPAAGQTGYLRELILKDAVFLLGSRWFDPQSRSFRHDKPPVKAVVIACNTATAYGMEDLRAAFAAWDIPVAVIGVVEAGARGTQEAQKQNPGSVGVLATVGTCASGAYPRLIRSTLGLAGREVPAITQHGSASLAGVVEGDPAFPQSLRQCALDEARALLKAHQAAPAQPPLSTVVLGCTHYPLAIQELGEAFHQLRQEPEFKNSLAGSLVFVDPAEWTARELFRTLASERLRNQSVGQLSKPQDRFYLSVPNPLRQDLPLSPDGTLDKDFKYQRQPGHMDREDTVNVPLDPASLPATGRELLESRLPAVWGRMHAFALPGSRP